MTVEVKEWGSHFLVYVNGELAFILIQMGNSLYMINESSKFVWISSHEEGIGSIVAGALKIDGKLQIEMLT